jgi:hypothetical protein
MHANIAVMLAGAELFVTMCILGTVGLHSCQPVAHMYLDPCVPAACVHMDPNAAGCGFCAAVLAGDVPGLSETAVLNAVAGFEPDSNTLIFFKKGWKVCALNDMT